MGFKLFNYPQQAIFRKVLPKSKIYEFAKPSNAVKGLFVRQVEQIVWEYKLSPEIINIPAGEGVEEIQVLKIQSKVPGIDYHVYQTIDEAIPSQIFYEVAYGGKLKLVAAYKRLSEVDSSKWVTGPYFESGWVSYADQRSELPFSLNMGQLYSQMLRILIGDKRRDGETLKSQVERLEIIRLKNNEIEKLKIKLRKEKQFNRKVEVNAQIKQLESQLHLLLI